MKPNVKRKTQLIIGLAVFAVAVTISYFSTSDVQIQEPVIQDLFLVIDTSGSMASDSKLDFAKKAASEFVNTFEINGTSSHRIGLIAFANEATLVIDLTSDSNVLNNGIMNLIADGSTTMGDGILLAKDLLSKHGRSNVSKSIVLLSDGMATVGVLPHFAALETSYANIPIYSVGYGYDADVNTLRAVSSITDGDYFAALTGQDLALVFNEIAESLISPVSHYSSRVMMLVAIPILLFIPAIEAGMTTLMGLTDASVQRNVTKRKCSYCQHANRQKAKFCLKCGKSLQQEQHLSSYTDIVKKDTIDKQCPSCHYSNRQIAKFCLKCGKMIEQTHVGDDDLR